METSGEPEQPITGQEEVPSTQARGDVGSTGAALVHLEWSSLADRVWAGLASDAAKQRYGSEDGSGSDPDRILPRTACLAHVRCRYREIHGLEVLERQVSHTGRSHNVGGPLAIVQDIQSTAERAARASLLEVEDLCEVADLTRAAVEVAEMLDVAGGELRQCAVKIEADQAAFAILGAALAGLQPPTKLAEALERSLDRSGEPRLSDRASESLGRLRKRAQQARQAVTAVAERLIRTPTVARALADRYFTEREGRVVLPVRSDAFSRAGGSGTVTGIIHGSSGSGQTLFVEPHALVDAGNTRREAVMAVKAEERRILTKLSQQVGEHSEALCGCVEALVELDRIYAKLKLARQLDAIEPELFDDSSKRGALELRGARHPLMALGGTEVVPNDLRVRAGTGLIISGPNAGGKTVALKTLGLCALMAQAGLRLPTAHPASMPLYFSVVTDVGDDQSIAGGLSTFSAHIGHVMEALDAAASDGSRTLVLLDEVAVGTDPEQGAALAESIVVELVDAGATIVVTTHYERLKLLATAWPERFANAAVGFDFEALRPTFEVRMGPPGASSALTVAGRLGVPAVVLERAESLLDDAHLKVDALLREVEAERERIAVERTALALERRTLEAEQRQLKARQQREEDTAAARRAKAHEGATSALRELEAQIKRRRKELRKAGLGEPGDPGVTDPHERSFARDARRKLDDRRTLSGPAPGVPPDQLEVGDRVLVTAMDTKGKVLSLGRGDKVVVQLALAKMTVSRAGLRLVEDRCGPAAARARRVSAPSAPLGGSDARKHFGGEPVPVEARLNNVVDLRGVRAEEALTMLEVFLDRAIGEDVDVVIIRHGHGTGALRKAVREHLPHLGHVGKQRCGLTPEGGDAVTVVWIRL